MKKHIAAITCLLLMIGIVLSACGGSGTGPSGTNEKITLNVELWDQKAQGFIDKTLAVYKQKHPNVEVNVTYTPFANYWEKMQTSLTGGAAADVFWLNYANFYKYASLDLIKDLTPLTKEQFDQSAYLPVLIDMFSYNGKLMGLPYFQDIIALLYNKQLFDQAKVPFPTNDMTWDNIKEMGQKLTDKSKGIYGYNIEITSTQAGSHNYIYQNGGFVINKERTKSGYDAPETIQALQFMKSILDAGISPSAKTQLETDGRQLFTSGKLAMLPVVSSWIPTGKEALKDNLGITELPKGKQKAAVMNGITWAMNKNTKHEKEAWELMKVLSGEEGEKLMAESGFSIPSLKNPEIQKIWANSLPGVNMQVLVDSLKFAVPRSVSKNSSVWWDHEKIINDAFLGKLPVEEAAKTLAKQMNEDLAKEK